MTELTITSQEGTKAVLKLREQKLRSGQVFMINTKELAIHQCYLEYPDGSIKLASITPGKRDMHVMRELSPSEAQQLRVRFHLALIK